MKIKATIVFNDQSLNNSIAVEDRQTEFEDETMEDGTKFPALAQVARFGQMLQNEGLLMTVKGKPVWYPSCAVKKLALEESRIQTL